MKSAKSIFLSKTFWVNAAIGAATLAGVMPTNKTVVAAAAVLNLGLRMATKEPVRLPKVAR